MESTKKQMMKENERNQLRRRYQARRNALTASDVSRLSLKISERILAWELYQRAEWLFFYYPLGKEVSLLPVMKEALQKGRHIALPKTTGERMEFYEVTDLGDLREGHFHVMEPLSEGRKPVCREPELCFVPGTAFAQTGARYGYGRGYYDRYFAKKDTVKLAGCAYACQIAEKLPIDIWDVKMDYLLSENGIIQVEKA